MRRSKTKGTLGVVVGRGLRRWLPVSFAVALTLLVGSADAWAKGNAPPAPPIAAAPAEPTPPPDDALELARGLAFVAGVSFDDLYAQREQAAEALGRFEGGDVVIISSGAVIIVLLIILILVIA